MLKRLLLLLIILLESGIFYAGNPVMLVRCGRPRLAVNNGLAVGCSDLGNYVTYEGHCYAVPEDGACPNYPESIVLVSMDVDIDGEIVTICVPSCESTCEESSCDTEPTWDPILQKCSCEDEIYEEDVTNDLTLTCGCPFFLELSSVGSLPTAAPSSSECLAPQKACYEADISFAIEPFVCDGPEAASDTIKIVIKAAGGANFMTGVDALTISALQNCNLVDGTEALLTLTGLFGGDTEAAFVADENGCIIVEFTRDPNQETVISLPGADTIITIPACPRAFDPCSCSNPYNVTQADGTVLLWYDVLTVVGAIGTPVILKNNASPAGFLDTTTQASVANGTDLGSIGPMGTLTVPFLRTPGTLTDLELTQTVNSIERSTFLVSGCSLAVNACVVNPIPTMGQWGLTILGLALLIIGIASFSVGRFKIS